MVLLGTLLAVFLFDVPMMLAAPLNWNAATALTLTSPATTLTVTAGSLADVLQVNAGSVAVTLSNSTGGAFTILSPAYDLAVATSSGGGTVSTSCTLGVASTSITQASGATVYTLTPSGSTCAASGAPIITNISVSGITTNAATIAWTTNIAADSTVTYGTTLAYGSSVTDGAAVTSHVAALTGLAANTLYHFAVASQANGTSTVSSDNVFTTAQISGGISVSVGNGGGSTTNTSSSSTPASSLQEQIAFLQAQLQSLLQQVAQRAAGVSQSGGSGFRFTRNLSLWQVGADVTLLQQFLINQNKGPSARKLAQHGTTKTFGYLTYYALKEYQARVGIVPAFGYFGPKTRAYINSIQ
jgi:hypothetical protein